MLGFTKNYHLLLFILFSSFSLKGIGQNMRLYENEVVFPSELGAPDLIVGFQDINDIIWAISTKSELYRYNGQEITKFGTTHGIPKGGSTVIFGDSDGMIWLPYQWPDKNEKKVYIFDPIKKKTITLSEYHGSPVPFDENNVLSVKPNNDGTVWFYLQNNDVFELKSKQFSYWGSIITDEQNSSLFKDKNGVAYHFVSVNVTSKVECFLANDMGKKEFVLPKEQHIRHFIDNGTMDTYQNGVLAEVELKLYKKSTLVFFSFEDGITYLDTAINPLSTSYSTINDKILRLTDSVGVVLDESLNEIVHFPYSETEVFLFGDHQGGWWTKSDDFSLKRTYLKKNLFTHYNQSLKDVEWHRAARGISITKAGDLFIAKGGSLCRINRNGEVNFIRLPSRYNYSGDYFGLRMDEKSGTLWVTAGSEILEFNIDKNVYETNYSLKSELGRVWQTHLDKKGGLWAGGALGLCKRNPENSTFEKFNGYDHYPLPEKFVVFDFYENESGIWLMSGEGLFLVDQENKRIQHYHTEGEGLSYLPHNIIAHLQEDENGNFWMASKGGGLIHWNPESGEIEQYTTKNGLKNNIIYACYQDEFNQVWLTSNNGLMRFDKTTHEVIHYTINDGLLHEEFNTISHFEDNQGRFYFGGLNGVISFHPKDFMTQKNPYKLCLSALITTNYEDSVYNNDLAEILSQNQITIHPNDKEVQVNFALLNYENSDHWDYEYKIEGFHKEWKATEKPVVMLRDLPYGTYKLLFRCQISGYDWKAYESPIKLVVLAPYYKTWWFIIAVVLLFALSIWLLIRWRLSSARKREFELEEMVAARTSEMLKQAEELKSLDKMKTQFFANISHELRTPLTLILGPVREMKSKNNGEINPFQMQANLDVIDRNAEKLLGLVEEVLNLSKLDAGKLHVSETVTSLLDFTRYIKSHFETNAELNEIQYHLNYELSAKSSFYLDQPKVETILTNFLSNAFKFCGENGLVSLDVAEEKSTLIFTVNDKGIGIKKEDLPFVFDRFYQVRPSSNAANGGTGIGLSLSRELAQLMGGQVWVESIYGEGSSFYLKLPKKAATLETVVSNGDNSEIKTISHRPITELDHEKPCVLLVEDNPDMSEFIRSILIANYAIITANNGAEGLRILKEKSDHIELIISDVMMPIMDGFTMLEKIKGHERLFNLPIIMLTARASEQDKLHALTIGADDYLTKPFSSQELQVRIQNLLANYQSRKLWKNELTLAVKSISDQSEPTQKAGGNPIEIEESEISKKDLIWLKEVERHINEELNNETFDIQALADKMFQSKRQFERKIKLLTGLTPAKLVLEIRLKKGRRYLEDGNFSSVSEVSYAIGIQTPSYFTKLYEKRFGRKPSSYYE